MKLHQTTSLLFAAATFLYSVGAHQSSYPHVPHVQTSSGLLRGFSPADDVHAYVGIRYAQPPLGSLRFEPPQPYTPNNTNSLLDATQTFPSCYQIQYDTFLSDKIPGYAESEDCLFLNIWKPAFASAEKTLPVLISIYGGGFSQGGTTQYEGVEFVTGQKDIIFVDFNYRVNIFGFPNSPAVETKNIGLLDQRLAIEWLRDNIAAFGGDPSRMTVIGQSAGGQSIMFYSYTYIDDPIVAGMISWSGQPEGALREDGSSWRKVAKETNCAKKTSPKEELKCLKDKPPRVLRRAITPNNLVQYGEATGGVPVVDNKTVLTVDEYAKRGKIGQFSRVPIWIGHVRNEGDNLVAWDPYITNGTGINYTLSDFITLFSFHCPVAAAAAYRAANRVPIYRTLYSGTFSALEPYPWARSYHAIDIYHFFGHERIGGYQELSPEIEVAGKVLRDAVGAFVRDPTNGLKHYGWPIYNPEEPTIINLFPNNTEEYFFESPREYDAVCESLNSK